MDERGRAERARLAKRSRDLHSAASEVGAIQAPLNPIQASGLGWTKRRRDACEYDLHAFLVYYFPNGTGQKPFGAKQVEAIKHLEHCILHSGRRLNLLPRGYCKSSISEGACLWATLYGHRRFVMFLAANESEAQTGIESIQRELSDNPLLKEDFPEACLPIAKLEGKPQRCNSQTHDGQLTHIEWTSSRIVFPEIDGSKSSGAIISADGLLAASRGARHKRSDGSTARPDFVIVDDPQTDQSAISPTETAKRLRILSKSIMRLGGHGKAVSAVCNATMIAAGDFVDQLSDRKKFPAWVTVRTPTVLVMPTALETSWLKPYADLLKDFDEHDGIDGQRLALERATDYYQANRAVMDDGAIVAWDDVPLEDGEVSALQHAMNILVLDGESVFSSECQNCPTKQDIASHLQVTKKLSDRLSGYARGQTPELTGFHTFFVDNHDEILYWARACVSQDFSGSVVDYGTWPKQPVTYFSHNAVKRKLVHQYPGETTENAMRLGLTELLTELATFELPLSVGLVDAGYKPDIVAHAIRLSGLSNVYGSHGIGIGPESKPMPEYDTSPKRVSRCGPDPRRPRWYFPRDIAGRVHFDANFWKDFAVSRLTQEAATGAWTLFGNSQQANHEMYVDHLCSEQPTAVTAKGRTVNCWKVVAGRDNHYFDTFVGCVVAASIAGAILPGTEPLVQRATKPRKRYGGSSPLAC